MSTSTERLRLRAEDAQRVLLVRAFEDADPRGQLLPLDVRRAATASATSSKAGSPSTIEQPKCWLTARARALSAHLQKAPEGIRVPLLELTDPGRGWVLVAVLIGVVLGLLTNALGPGRHVHILALPLLGILIWNLAAVVVIVARRAIPIGTPANAAILKRWQSLGARAVRRSVPAPVNGDVATKDATTADAATADEEVRSSIRRRAIDDYLKNWLPAAGPLAGARLERAFHAGALAIAAGVVAGMYPRGLAFEYRAGWESTFLEPTTVSRLVDFVLGPASALSGIAIPDVEALEGAAGASNASAAPWIHLWAITTVLVVGVPRGLLFLISSLRVARRRRRLPIAVSSTYLRRLLSAVDPTSRRVDVLAYSYRPSGPAVATLKQLVLDVFGARAELHMKHVDYGAEVADLDSDGPSPARCRVILFNLAQTPEAEVHGDLITALMESAIAGQAVIVAVDEGAYRTRLGAGSDQRVDDRFAAWERMFASMPGDAPRQGAIMRVNLASSSALDPARVFAAAWPEGALDDLRRGR